MQMITHVVVTRAAPPLLEHLIFAQLHKLDCGEAMCALVRGVYFRTDEPGGLWTFPSISARVVMAALT